MEVEGSILGGGKSAPHVRRQTECNYKKTKEKAVEYHMGGASQAQSKAHGYAVYVSLCRF